MAAQMGSTRQMVRPWPSGWREAFVERHRRHRGNSRLTRVMCRRRGTAPSGSQALGNRIIPRLEVGLRTSVASTLIAEAAKRLEIVW